MKTGKGARKMKTGKGARKMKIGIILTYLVLVLLMGALLFLNGGCVNVRAPEAKGAVEVNTAIWKSNSAVKDEAKASVHAETDARSDADLAP